GEGGGWGGKGGRFTPLPLPLSRKGRGELKPRGVKTQTATSTILPPLIPYWNDYHEKYEFASWFGWA
ncbi:MAG: hypothetical protein FWC35_00085, partial [Proteobacteria bacterium]|nr:hypothetical protein [Pseudomonadota bacterium]